MEKQNNNESWYARPLVGIIILFSIINLLFGNLYLKIVGAIGIIMGITVWQQIKIKDKEEQ